jgi:hypothetical protein
MEDRKPTAPMLTTSNLEQVVVPDVQHLFAPVLLLRNHNGGPYMRVLDPYRFIITVPSSRMQLVPITTGPVCPKITTFG